MKLKLTQSELIALHTYMMVMLGTWSIEELRKEPWSFMMASGVRELFDKVHTKKEKSRWHSNADTRQYSLTVTQTQAVAFFLCSSMTEEENESNAVMTFEDSVLARLRGEVYKTFLI